MSKGGGGGGSGGTQTVINKTELPGWVTDAAKRNLNQAYEVSQNMMAPYAGQRVADMTPGQAQVIQALMNNVGSTNPAFSRAQGIAERAGNYSPIMVGAQQVAAPTVNPGTYDAAMIGNPGRVSADQVTPGFLSGMNLSSYMNPFTRDVIGTGMAAIDTQRQQALNQNADAAIRARAFGGGRHGVIDAVTNTGAATAAGKLASELQAQNFGQAQQAAQADLARSLQAQGMNQGANLTADQTSLQAALQAALANQASSNQAGQFNTNLNFLGQTANQQAALQAALANQGASLQAGMANQNAGLQGAGLNLSAAGRMGDLASQGQSSFLQGASAALAGQDALQGQQQRILDAARQYYGEQQQFPLQQLQIPLMALGMTPYGQTNTQTGPAPQQSSNGFLSGLGGAAAGIGILGSLFGGGGLFPGAFGLLR